MRDITNNSNEYTATVRGIDSEISIIFFKI